MTRREIPDRVRDEGLKPGMRGRRSRIESGMREKPGMRKKPGRTN
jgi:hypothetical protein